MEVEIENLLLEISEIRNDNDIKAINFNEKGSKTK